MPVYVEEYVYVQSDFQNVPLKIRVYINSEDELGNSTTVDDLLALVMAELALPLTYTNRLGITHSGKPIWRRLSTLKQEGIHAGDTVMLSSPM